MIDINPLVWSNIYLQYSWTIRILSFFKCLFIFETERERAQVGEREGDRGSEAGFALTAESPMGGLTHELQGHDLS